MVNPDRPAGLKYEDIDLRISDVREVRIERMSRRALWMRIYVDGDNDIVLWLSAPSGHLICDVEYD